MSVTTLPRYTDIELETACLRVKRLLLQVRIREGWTSVWYSEKLVDVFGDSLYESPCFSLDDLSTVDAFDRFVLEFGLLPWYEIRKCFRSGMAAAHLSIP